MIAKIVSVRSIEKDDFFAFALGFQLHVVRVFVFVVPVVAIGGGVTVNAFLGMRS